MTEQCSRSLLLFLVAGFIGVASLETRAGAQQTYYPNHQEFRISGLPTLMAPSKDPQAVLATAVEIAFHDREVCCGKDSTLEDDVQRADPKSLKDVATRLQGRHLLSDGRPIVVTAQYASSSSAESANLIAAMRSGQRPLLMRWNSHVYVVYGALFDEVVDQNAGLIESVHKLFLIDPRFSDARREVVFDRQTDDFGKTQGLLMLKVTQP